MPPECAGRPLQQSDTPPSPLYGLDAFPSARTPGATDPSALFYLWTCYVQMTEPESVTHPPVFEYRVARP
jgi:hypothetical protein